MKDKITEEFIEELWGEESEIDSHWKGDNAYQGLQIIAKYYDPLKEDLITYGSHDVMGSVDMNELIERGVTKEDLISLKKLNWSYDEDGGNLYVFV